MVKMKTGTRLSETQSGGRLLGQVHSCPSLWAPQVSSATSSPKLPAAAGGGPAAWSILAGVALLELRDSLYGAYSSSCGRLSTG